MRDFPTDFAHDVGLVVSGAPLRPPRYPAGRIAVNVVEHHVIGRFPAGRAWLQRHGEKQLRDAQLRILDGEIPDVVPLPE